MPAFILLVEDDPVQQKVAELYVNRYKAFKRYLSYNKARAAFEFIYNNRLEQTSLPDIILLDLHMPDFSGWDFLEAFEELIPIIQKPIEVFILSSSLDPEDQERSRHYSFVKGFYSKPISKAIIEDISGKILSPP